MIVRDLKRLNRVDNRYGVEVEVEGVGVNTKCGLWNVVRDGSLRAPNEGGGVAVEFTVKGAVNFEEIPTVLEELGQCLDGATVKDSPRTSVHVHINTQDLELLQLYNLFFTLLLFEEVMVDNCSKSRNNNAFCLKYSDSPRMIKRVADGLRSISSVGALSRAFTSCNHKYMSINTESLGLFGTLEVRLLEFSGDLDKTGKWLFMLDWLFKFSTTAEDSAYLANLVTNNPLAVVDEFEMVVGWKVDMDSFYKGWQSAMLFSSFYDGSNLKKTKRVGGVDFPFTVGFVNDPEVDL